MVKNETAGLSSLQVSKSRRGLHQACRPPPCCFPSPPVSGVCWFVGFGPDWLKALIWPLQPREDWITPSIEVSCQMVSCTCCLKQGGPAAAAWPALERIITRLKDDYAVYTCPYAQQMTVSHTHGLYSPTPSPPTSP